MSQERVEAVNPIYGMRIIDKYDPHPCGYSENALIGTLNSISETRHDYDMLMECASFEEVDAYYNPGLEKITDDFILEAIVVDKFSKTEHRMAAVVRVMNKHLGDSEINALAPIVGKPKKTGSYAYVTVQLPFSDGQVVSVVFHAPEGDKKKIGPSDQIIAFRWLLNKRDITQVVAPEDGSEISLEAIAKRITQLVVKNSARFERTQKEAQAERQELEKAREDLKEAQARQEELIQNMETSSKDNETLAAQLSNTLALLENQKTINAELQAKLDALRKSIGGNGGNSGNGKGGNAGTGNDDERNKKRRDLQDELRDKSPMKIFHYAYEHNDENPFLPSSENSDAYELGRYYRANSYSAPAFIKKSRGYNWNIFAKNKKDVTATVRIENEVITLLSGTFVATPPSNPKPSPGEDPKYVRDLQDILAGKYDSDSSKVIELLENAIDEAESSGLMEQYEALLNDASNHLTDLLAEEAKNV